MEEEINSLRDKLAKYEKKYGPLIEKRGFHNFKNLFRKPTGQEWLTLFMLVMALFMAWAYQYDIATCQAYIQKDIDTFERLKNQTIQNMPNRSIEVSEFQKNFNFTLKEGQNENLTGE